MAHLDSAVVKVVIAPDKFKGTLSAPEAAAVMAEGWQAARPSDEIVTVPLADGGEGFCDTVCAAVPGAQQQRLVVADARGYATEGSWGLLPDGRGIVEAAQACGLARLPAERREPRLATSYGVGELVRAAVDAGATEVVVGVGGTASCDGGAGMAIALGHRLLRWDHNGVKVGAQFLAELERIVAAAPLGVPVTTAVDVRDVLLGPHGAAALYGPQKGLAAHDVPLVDAVLRRLAAIAERDLPGGPWRELPGAGAGGGLGFGLAAFAGAALVDGAAFVGQVAGLDAALEGAEVVVTGEGALDAQTAEGKVPSYVLARGRKAGARVLAVAGSVTRAAAADFDAVAELGPDGLAQPARTLRARTEALARG